jgi:hypothetical protein
VVPKYVPKWPFSFGEVEDIIDRIRLVGEVLGGFLTSKSARGNIISELLWLPPYGTDI